MRSPPVMPVPKSPPPTTTSCAPAVVLAERTFLLEELAGGVVGQHLAAGLAGGAVVHLVLGVRHFADGVAAHRTRFAGAVVHPTRPIGRRAHVGPAPLVGQ